ncbi:unnamed protein product [Urochloa humidicola]
MASAALARDADSLANNNDGVLPSDVLYEVLLRVPAKSLCRLRLVCRSWRSLTSNPRFARAHSARHPLFVVHDDGDQEEPEIHIIDMYSGSIVKRISCDDLVKGVYGGIGEYLCKIMSTEASLVCISTSDGINELNIVLNPATGAVKILPDGNTLGLGKSCIIGYVPSTREYKVLHLCNYVTPEETFKVACEVITLGGYGDDDKRWRAKPSPVDISPNFHYIAVVHGVAYFWSSNDEDDDDNDDTMPSVALFDLATEKWRPSILPGPISCHLCHQDLDQIQFNNFDGCLVISHHKVRDCSTGKSLLNPLTYEGWSTSPPNLSNWIFNPPTFAKPAKTPP